jgi:hypothetical protein
MTDTPAESPYAAPQRHTDGSNDRLGDGAMRTSTTTESWWGYTKRILAQQYREDPFVAFLILLLLGVPALIILSLPIVAIVTGEWWLMLAPAVWAFMAWSR